VARIYDYFLGGFHNLAIDRAAAQRILSVEPDFALMLQANRAFLRRVVAFAVSARVCQFLDLGSGIPSVRNVHQVAQELDPAARVVYVDSDPIAITLSRDILSGNANVVALHADAMRPEQLLQHPDLTSMLDFSQPLAVLLLAFLHFIADDGTAIRLVRYLRDFMAPGSYLIITHASNIFAERSERTLAVYNRATSPVTLRSREQIELFFEGFELIEPGLVPTPLWRPESNNDLFVSEPERGQAFAGVGRKR
jgi:hypothetical protein